MIHTVDELRTDDQDMRQAQAEWEAKGKAERCGACRYWGLVPMTEPWAGLQVGQQLTIAACLKLWGWQRT